MGITSKELREKYIEFFKGKKHAEIAGASLIPENDPTVLFTTAGMHPLVPYLMGEKHPGGKRLVNCQKCIRTGDIDEVGDQWHLTFFEMLGNWSLGDYFKEEAIRLSFEFLTGKKWLSIPAERLSVSCFKGDKNAPRDDRAAKYWEEAGIPKERIHFLPKSENWWGPAGETGPCGPDTEMFYHVTDDLEKSTAGFKKLDNEEKVCEIWNDVFMQYDRQKDGTYMNLTNRNVDTGMGLERVVAVLNGYDNVYECDTLKPVYEKVKGLAGKEIADEGTRSARIITDHLRAATFILGDEKGIVPSNVDQGYILRRFIRRSVRHARLLGIKGKFCREAAEAVVKSMGNVYPELEKNKERIFSELDKEEEKFSVALKKGMNVAAKLFQKKKPIDEEKFVRVMSSPEKRAFFIRYLEGKFDADNSYGISREELDGALITGKEAFNLFQSYGFPLEMIDEIATEARLVVDHLGFRKEVKSHQELSRKGAEQKFKGGLADAKEETTKLHTAAHLMLAAMRETISGDIVQKGSNINAERLRFDFNSDERLTNEQLKGIEDWVNEAIEAGADITEDVLPLDEAKKGGAHGTFESKYGDNVKVYTIKKGDRVYSKEICGGPHVKTTKGMGHFRIKKQESVAAGVKRIKAVLE